MKQRLEFPDFAKGYAILSIVVYHALQRLPLPPALAQAIVLGGTGVHLFFFLSGFGLSLGGTTLAPGAFYRRRLVKIWWPYALALTLSLAAALTLGVFADGWSAWLAGVGLYQMFSATWIESFGGHFWFISAIVQLYVVFPFLSKTKTALGPLRFVGVCLLASVTWWCLVFWFEKGHLRHWNSCFLQFLWEFGLGMAAPELLRRLPADHALRRWWQPSAWWRWGLVGVTGVGLMVLLTARVGAVGRIFNDLPALVGYGALCVGVYWLAVGWADPIRRFFLWVGGFSFSLYLTHVLVLELLLHALAWGGAGIGAWYVPVFVVLALAGGWLFERVPK
jgi:peptidoglycan/LPS O-acetylase OafA/YrhL